MLFNKHSGLAGTHAFLSASNPAWLNYDEEKLSARFVTAMAAQRGTELHAFAHEAIRLKIKLPSSKTTMNLYVNDAIGYRMTPEQILFYSLNCYGTADAISFHRNVLRIHDLKTGVIQAPMTQLKVYAAFFCLEYGIKPHRITKIELRIYQSDEIKILEADPDEIQLIMDKIVRFDKLVAAMRAEAEA